ncbi:MAG: DUF3352 domain-containing protein, partial [Chloroflexota bacterium]
MRKLLALTSLLLLLLTASFVPVAAAPVDDLTALAEYVPAKSSVYLAVRTDDGYIEQLDGVIGALNDKLGGILPEEINVLSFLNATLQDVLDEDIDFEDEVRPWLGDIGAIVVTVPDPFALDIFEDDIAGAFVFAVSDGDEARDFWDGLLEDDYDIKEAGEGVLYTPANDDMFVPSLYLTDNVLVYRTTAVNPDTLILGEDDDSLADNDEFVDAMNRLPEDDYNGVVYAHPSFLMSELDDIQDDLDDAALPIEDIDLEVIATAIGPQSAGFTILDDRNFVLDIATNVANRDVLTDAGITFTAGEAINLSFTDLLPENTMLFVQDTGLGSSLISAFAQLEALGDYYDELWEAGDLSFRDRDLTNIDNATIFVRQAIEGLAGLTLQEAFGWMTGDYIVYTSVLTGISEDIPVLPDVGIIVEDTGDASILSDAVPDVLYQLGLDSEDDDGITVIPAFGNILQTNDMDILIGADNGVYVTGTRATIGDVLDGNGGLTTTDAFANASNYFLEDAQALAYVNVPPIVDIATGLAELGVPD